LGQLVISQIYQLKKSITFIKSFPNFHKQFSQIPSNLTIYPLIQTTLLSTYNTLKFLQIHSPNQTKPLCLLLDSILSINSWV